MADAYELTNKHIKTQQSTNQLQVSYPLGAVKAQWYYLSLALPRTLSLLLNIHGYLRTFVSSKIGTHWHTLAHTGTARHSITSWTSDILEDISFISVHPLILISNDQLHPYSIIFIRYRRRRTQLWNYLDKIKDILRGSRLYSMFGKLGIKKIGSLAIAAIELGTLYMKRKLDGPGIYSKRNLYGVVFD